MNILWFSTKHTNNVSLMFNLFDETKFRKVVKSEGVLDLLGGCHHGSSVQMLLKEGSPA